MSLLLCDRSPSLRRSRPDLESVADNARYSPFTQHFRTNAEEADPVLDGRAHGTVWAVRRRSAASGISGSTDQLHERFQVEALPDRGESTPDRARHFGREIRRPPLRQDTVSDARYFLFRAEWPPHRVG